MESAGDKTSEAYKNLAKDTADLEKSYAANEKQINSSTRNALNFSTQANETRVEMEKLQKSIDETSDHLEEAINSSDGYAHSMDEVGDSADSMSGKISAAFDAAASTIAAAGIERAFDSVKQLILDCTDASIEFESAITGVFKTVDGRSFIMQKSSSHSHIYESSRGILSLYPSQTEVSARAISLLSTEPRFSSSKM